MKVEGPRGPGKASAPKKSARTTGPGFANALKRPDPSESSEAEDPVEASHGAAPATSLDALLAIQGVEETPDATKEKRSGNKVARAWGEELLDGLEEIRRDLLRGDVPPERLAELARSVSDRKALAEDPKLSEILADIELRARVELAKYRRRG